MPNLVLAKKKNALLRKKRNGEKIKLWPVWQTCSWRPSSIIRLDAFMSRKKKTRVLFADTAQGVQGRWRQKQTTTGVLWAWRTMQALEVCVLLLLCRQFSTNGSKGWSEEFRLWEPVEKWDEANSDACFKCSSPNTCYWKRKKFAEAFCGQGNTGHDIFHCFPRRKKKKLLSSILRNAADFPQSSSMSCKK